MTPANYGFTLKSIEIFMPGKSIEEVKKANSSFDVFSDNGDQKILRFKLIYNLFLHFKNIDDGR